MKTLPPRDVDRPPLVSAGPHVVDHRFGRRLQCGASVRILAGTQGDADGRLRNVSLSGAFIETALRPEPFTVVTIASTRPANAAEPLSASVVRHDVRGIGVEWCETPVGPVCRMFGCAQPCEPG